MYTHKYIMYIRGYKKKYIYIYIYIYIFYIYIYIYSRLKDANLKCF